MINFQEDGHACYVINDCVIFSPFGCSCPNNSISSLLWAILKIVWPYYFSYHFVGEELPNSITCYDDELVFRLKFEPHYLRFTAYTHRVSDKITKRPAHSETGCVLLLQPHPHWTQILSHTTFYCINSSTDRQDSLLLYWHTWFMILTQWRDLDATLSSIVGIKYSSWVTSISWVNRVTIKQNCHTRRTTKDKWKSIVKEIKY